MTLLLLETVVAFCFFTAFVFHTYGLRIHTWPCAAVGWPAGNEMSPSRVTLPAYQGNTYVGRGYTSAGIIGRVVMDGWHMWLPATEL